MILVGPAEVACSNLAAGDAVPVLLPTMKVVDVLLVAPN